MKSEENEEEEMIDNPIYLNDKIISQLLIYLLYCLAQDQPFKGDINVINEVMKFIMKVLERDDMKIMTLKKSSKIHTNISSKYFLHEMKIESLFNLFTIIIYRRDTEFIQEYFIHLLKLYIESDNEKIIELMKENKKWLENIFIELERKELITNESLSLIGISCTKYEMNFNLQQNDLFSTSKSSKQFKSIRSSKSSGRRSKGFIEGNNNLINQLLLKSKHNLINYFTQINDKELTNVNEIGKGAYATVKKGYYRENEVAIKIFEEDSYQFKREDFLQEIGLLSLLHHENVIKTYGAVLDLYSNKPSVFKIVTEYVSHGSLEMAIANGLLKKNESLQQNITIGMIKGLDYLHSMNIIHRDLKPANILIGENNEAKISDFGLSTFACEKELDVIMGSFKWMSPERFLEKKYGKESDIYSMGIIMWQIYEEDEPFKEYDIIDDLKTAVCERNERPVFISTPEFMRDIIELCWNKKCEKRLSTREIIHKLSFNNDNES